MAVRVAEADAPWALPVLYRDAVLAVVDKPNGLMAHASPMARGESDFALDRLRRQFGADVFLAHRLDRATSGCLLVAFDRGIAAELGRAFMARGVDKTYLALCRGWPEARFSVDHPLDGGPGKPEKKPALTHFERLATAELPVPSGGFETTRFSLLRCRPETGRWRQIRRHLKHAMHHLVGDSSHGDGRRNRIARMQLGVHRMLLHAWQLGFAHPVSGARLVVTAPPDAEWRRLCERLGLDPALLDAAPMDGAAAP
ncbi:pseudouridine synthase [Coralloluteibacterium stylophorae]|uniref:tRNA pseudouridine synthase C n=1 Tax=Coralloluteibacterium stylophorae TaxID=1776034 RepID=A0AAP2CBM5_9GAMM|nr:pseudouridine synthase [Coralloluteibacterium stylophorae]MBS7457460.1 pseudouridylate synthase [Coralloluteibacterium stylophorae]